MEAESSEAIPSGGDVPYAVKVGALLRAARRQRQLSLQAVEARSGHEFKASVLGAYERGERTISVPRLVRLAKVYGVPATQLVPEEEPELPLEADVEAAVPDRLTVNLTALETLIGPERELLGRFLELLQRHRDEELTVSVPVADLRAIVSLLELVADTVRHRLNRLGAVSWR
jgi:transcriptional regulator with XRE-family HTH domain